MRKQISQLTKDACVLYSINDVWEGEVNYINGKRYDAETTIVPYSDPESNIPPLSPQYSLYAPGNQGNICTCNFAQYDTSKNKNCMIYIKMKFLSIKK